MKETELKPAHTQFKFKFNLNKSQKTFQSMLYSV